MTTETEQTVTLGELMDECPWMYDETYDDEPESGPKQQNDGYNVTDYFAVSHRTEVASREDGIRMLRAAYKGPDRFGVGLDLSVLDA